MEPFDAASWGERYAGVYDELLRGVSPAETEATVEVLAGLARGGRVLEIGVGTGRVALPLARRGLQVHGIDSSPAMIDKLFDDPDAGLITSAVADIASAELEGPYSLVFAVHNTISLLADEEAQIACFERVAEHLDEDGVFVVEAVVPVTPDSRGQSFTIWALDPDRLMISFSRHDARTRGMRTLELWLAEGDVRVLPSRERPVPPSELDLMARIAGLRLRERWETWEREPFTRLSEWHISVYGRG